jgi:hypothetical protein
MIRKKTNLLDGRLLLLLCLIFVLAACGPAGDEENENANVDNATTESTGYPDPSSNAADGSYPSPVHVQTAEEVGYPAPPEVATDKPAFQIDLPLTTGATTVTGQAPEEGLPLAIVDVSFGGGILGTGLSGEDGRFSIPITPLPGGHRIGVTITELEAGATFEEIAETYFPYRGEGFMNIPNLGIFYDSAMSSEP